MSVPDEFRRGNERWFLRGGNFTKQNIPMVRVSLFIELLAIHRGDNVPSIHLHGQGAGKFHWDHQAHLLTYDVRVRPSGSPLLPSTWPCEIRSGSLVLKTWMRASFLMDGQVQLRGTAELYRQRTLLDRRDFSFLTQGEEVRTEVLPLGQVNGDRGEVRIRTEVSEEIN
ncbi:hypothetical protein SAMN05444487_10371 [Marininema mesophilum]|uniref:Uncharacterized protein n=1 Tax=Marininema mesophilum TaxID=1048340 RepID=A0A1H2TAE0_9BACL|nr:hypothetical protein [Marininema mesophilum]SDW40665.1 hypothetical protein SAMN05444487_10371 [Marininema mesophilum]